MKLKKILAYIFRSWEGEGDKPHPKLQILPPFLLELLSYSILISILYYLGVYLYRFI
jgi:hypothetical protein